MENRKFSINYDGNIYEVATKLRKKGSELVLLLHGLGCSKDSFQDIWSRDELSDYSIMALDFIGFGDSSKTENFSYEMEDQASICAEVVRKFFSKKIQKGP